MGRIKGHGVGLQGSTGPREVMVQGGVVWKDCIWGEGCVV